MAYIILAVFAVTSEIMDELYFNHVNKLKTADSYLQSRIYASNGIVSWKQCKIETEYDYAYCRPLTESDIHHGP